MNLVSADTAVEEIKKKLREKYTDETVIENKSYSRKSLLNFRYNGRLTRYGDRRCILFDLDEVLAKLCG